MVITLLVIFYYYRETILGYRDLLGVKVQNWARSARRGRGGGGGGQGGGSYDDEF